MADRDGYEALLGGAQLAQQLRRRFPATAAPAVAL